MDKWHHRGNGHQLGQTSGDDEGQGGLLFCSPWSCKESDMTGRLNNNNVDIQLIFYSDFLSAILTHSLIRIIGE